MQHVIYDIETGARPESEIAQFMPEFSAPANYKDPEKIAAYVESAKRDWLDKAALSPLTGKVLCVGVLCIGERESAEPTIASSMSEADTLRSFWWIWGDYHDPGREFIGFNTHHFDLPFLIRRSWALGVTVPIGVRDGRRWHEKSIDLMELWCMGEKQDRISLDNVCRFLGIGEKNGSGKEFQTLWETDRAKACEYVLNDLELTRKLAVRLGVIPQPNPEEELSGIH